MTELVNFRLRTAMPQYLAALMIVLLLGTVLGRVLLLRRTGTQAMHFGELVPIDVCCLARSRALPGRYGGFDA